LAQYIFNLGGERPIDQANLLLNYYDPGTSKWMAFQTENGGSMKIEDLKNVELAPIVKTAGV
jgi:hypothetical protein